MRRPPGQVGRKFRYLLCCCWFRGLLGLSVSFYRGSHHRWRFALDLRTGSHRAPTAHRSPSNNRRMWECESGLLVHRRRSRTVEYIVSMNNRVKYMHTTRRCSLPNWFRANSISFHSRKEFVRQHIVDFRKVLIDVLTKTLAPISAKHFDQPSLT
jgi:hypothetical protein